MKEKETELLREKMYDCILKYGTNDNRTILASQKLDPYVTEEQREYGNN
ncbi:aspartyl-phosphate phosphatase Spo0E family protein [Clostridium butyricum]|uniref:Aspartyl-phosphate phosphatase Spo0E family protein n=1 Tax=Clostridium butyricum TaxID=1492 RepID=A0A512TQ89_CLOBU|nr:aspartyl-phosphate phosphatase Spo0E family protein [Clostridium butyricum]MBZ5748083.1 aspartyl-phosphate phosphatase Spo0E family protein [Clostridium butyricum]MCQ2017459.1 aspartyl-phosphate phosphatase Spo0E family protein [Clostridium butyricum]MCQ2023183.1 aspartyl-phosphate phosphatase Spo0E family protein [Clostridium butyricum]MCQ2026628.1 aspartyl-phosphate phosphatase Spo0E family protein [Clostridium butyricum]MDI9209202.1 aspartyl-phosphate phosphatase Spo0E family protein [Cl